MIPLITKRRVTVSRSDMIALPANEDSDIPPEIARMAKSTQEQCEKIVTGSVLLQYNGDPTVADDMQHTVPEEQKIQVLLSWK